MKAIRDSESGQAVLEFTVCSVIAAAAVFGVGKILKDEWNRSWCAYLTFETAHLRVIGSSGVRPMGRIQVDVEETEQVVQVVGRCGKALEKVRLPKLEAAAW